MALGGLLIAAAVRRLAALASAQLDGRHASGADAAAKAYKSQLGPKTGYRTYLEIAGLAEDGQAESYPSPVGAGAPFGDDAYKILHVDAIFRHGSRMPQFKRREEFQRLLERTRLGDVLYSDASDKIVEHMQPTNDAALIKEGWREHRAHGASWLAALQTSGLPCRAAAGQGRAEPSITATFASTSKPRTLASAVAFRSAFLGAPGGSAADLFNTMFALQETLIHARSIQNETLVASVVAQLLALGGSPPASVDDKRLRFYDVVRALRKERRAEAMDRRGREPRARRFAARLSRAVESAVGEPVLSGKDLNTTEALMLFDLGRIELAVLGKSPVLDALFSAPGDAADGSHFSDSVDFAERGPGGADMHRGLGAEWLARWKLDLQSAITDAAAAGATSARFSFAHDTTLMMVAAWLFRDQACLVAEECGAAEDRRASWQVNMITPFAAQLGLVVWGPPNVTSERPWLVQLVLNGRTLRLPERVPRFSAPPTAGEEHRHFYALEDFLSFLDETAQALSPDRLAGGPVKVDWAGAASGVHLWMR